MQGDAELLQLAKLLTLGAHTARQIADVRGHDCAKIYAIAAQAEEMATTLRRICNAGNADGAN